MPTITKITPFLFKKKSHFTLKGTGLDEIKKVTVPDAGGYRFQAGKVNSAVNSSTQLVIWIRVMGTSDDGGGNKEGTADRESTDEITVIVTNQNNQPASGSTEVVITDEDHPTT